MSPKMEATDPSDRGKRKLFSQPRRSGGGYQKKRKGHEQKKRFSPPKSSFTGLTEDMKGGIYNTGTGSQADHFIPETKAVSIYTGFTFNDAQESYIAVENLDEMKFTIP